MPIGAVFLEVFHSDVEAVALADLGTLAAAVALIIIDNSAVVLNLDSFVGAVLFAKLAADAADLAVLHSEGALLLVGAGYDNGICNGLDGDNAVGASLYASAAAAAQTGIDMSDAVFDADSIVNADICTIAKTKAAIDAGTGAAIHQLRSSAGGEALIIGLVFGVLAVALAVDNSGNSNHLACFLAEDSSHSLSAGIAAGSAEGEGQVGVFNEGSSIAAAAGEAAAAAVCAGESFGELGNALVNRNMHNLGCNSQNDSADDTDNGNNNNSNSNSHYFALLINRTGYLQRR